ncbi:MAG: flagellin [Pseudomonadota bacterium]|jgi:flagellin|nr:flagellin [Pseudomonadota bacterium]|tara:strand:- start:845 stop:1810 length:966 start_codon:yes stop_codon:yes gene_type:complete
MVGVINRVTQLSKTILEADVMSLVINTNVASLNAQRSLASSGTELKTAMERLSSGKQINSAADDAAGFAIAERMTAQIRGLNMATKNANDGLSMIATVENATNDVTDMLHRIRELAVQAANDTNSATDRGYLQNEVDSLLNEINRVAAQTVYNGAVVLDGSRDGSGSGAAQQIQVGTDSGQTISFDISAIDTDTLSLTTSMFTQSTSSAAPVATDVTGQTGTISVATASDAAATLTAVTAAIETVAGGRASLGAVANRLEYTVSNLMNVAEYTTAARSRIEDADFAAESARLAKAQVLQQTGTAMLAQANASQQLALSLFR